MKLGNNFTRVLSKSASEIIPQFHEYTIWLPINIMSDELVYVIGLHAVQFGNNWMEKIPRTAKICLSEEFFEIQLFPDWTSMYSSYLLII